MAAAGPFVIPLAMALAVFGAFTQYANPIVDPGSAAIPGSTDGPPAQIYAMAPDGGAQRRLTVIDGDARGPRMSPDGTSIVYSLRDGDDTQLHSWRPMGPAIEPSRPKAPMPGGLVARRHPDRFASDRDGGLDIYIMNADGSNVVRLTDDPAADWAPAWSPDGRFIAFNSNPDGELRPVRIDADGANRRS